MKGGDRSPLDMFGPVFARPAAWVEVNRLIRWPRGETQLRHEGARAGVGRVNSREEAIRFWLIRLPGRVLERGRRPFVRLAGGIRRTS